MSKKESAWTTALGAVLLFTGTFLLAQGRCPAGELASPAEADTLMGATCYDYNPGTSVDICLANCGRSKTQTDTKEYARGFIILLSNLH